MRGTLQDAGGAFVCRPSDSKAMAKIIGDLIARGHAGEPPPAPRPEVVARYAYPRLAASLAAVFDAVLGGTQRASAPELADRTA